MSARSITVFRTFPKELFRVSNGRVTSLREWSERRQKTFDLVTYAGKVHAKALSPQTYTAPNGASMRPISGFQYEFVRGFRGDSAVVYTLPAGTPLAEDLLLVHEHTDHDSLQAAEEMTLEDLNHKITTFLETNGRVMSKQEWLAAYKSAASIEDSSASP